MKALKITLSVLVLLFILIQLIPSGIPETEQETSENIRYSDLVPDTIQAQFRLSCFDCHSDQTNFPWYSKVAPVSWWLAGHIKEGKEHLNFSIWEQYSNREKLRLIDGIIEETKSGGMPLKSYLFVHKDARLSPDKIEEIENWGEEAAEKLLDR